MLEREFRTVPRIVDVCGWGGTVRRYEIQPDPDRLARYGVTLAQLQQAIQNSNATVGGDYVNQGQVAMTVRSVGLFGGGADPTIKVLGMTDPARPPPSSAREEQRRIRDIRSLVIASVNNQPVRVEDVVEGGRRLAGELGRPGRRRQPSDPPGANRLLEGRQRTPAAFAADALPRSATTSPTRSSASC